MDSQGCIRGLTGRRGAFGSGVRGVFGILVALGLLAGWTASAQTTAICNTAATVAAPVNSTGLTEKVGDIVITCSGGTVGATLIGALYISLNTNITNSLDASGNLQNITFSSTGATVTTTSLVQSSATTLQYSNFSYVIPGPSTTPVTLRVSGIRVAVAPLQTGGTTPLVTATIAAAGVSLAGTVVNVGIGTGAILSSTENNGISCAGSPLPSTVTFSGFIAAQATSSAVRVTESVAGAFAVKSATTTYGTRIIVNLSGYGTGVRLFVPDALVGNSGTFPTSGGEFAGSIGAGTYTPSGQLLLSRVSGADQYGNGGTLVTAVPATATTFSSVSELTVTNGAATAVYEVVDDNTSIPESFQVPVFVFNAPNNCAASLETNLSVSLAPISTVAVASATAPTPRYVAGTLSSDCSVVGDCASFYFPVLSMSSAPVTLTGTSLGTVQTASVPISNTGGSQLNLTVTVAYQSGSGWLTATPTTTSTGFSLVLSASPAALAPGTYTATVAVNAGVAGSASIPVTFTVGQVGVSILAIVSAASYQSGALATDSYAALFGSNLLGTGTVPGTPTVTFNGLTATILYSSASQINLIVPAALSGQLSASVVVSANGQTSNTYTVALASNAPALFGYTPGILNSDDSVNSSSAPATRGTTIQIYLTGLATPVLANSVVVNMGTQSGIVPLYAGAPYAAGTTLQPLDQINVTVPASLAFTGNSVPLTVCVTPFFQAQVCSNSVTLYVQ